MATTIGGVAFDPAHLSADTLRNLRAREAAVTWWRERADYAESPPVAAVVAQRLSMARDALERAQATALVEERVSQARARTVRA